MKHEETLNSRYIYLKTKGVKIDAHHHTHSTYSFEDGIAINRGDWLKNEWCKGICNVITKERLEALLIKQGLFERVCGYAQTKAELYWYILEYYCTCIDYDADFDNNIDWEDKIRKATDRAWQIPLEDIYTEPMRDNGKVKVDTKGRTKEEIGRLSKEGERRYNRWLVSEFVRSNPGMSKKWYMRNAEKIGLSESTVKRCLREI